MISKEAKFVSDDIKPTYPRGRTSANRNVKDEIHNTRIKKNIYVLPIILMFFLLLLFVFLVLDLQFPI